MNFNSVEEAKEYVVSKTSKASSLDKIEESILYYKKMRDEACSEDSYNLWANELARADSWKNSDDFVNGNYPQGIDELILEIIEWRAVINAFLEVNTGVNPFKESGFFAQWYVGGIYAIFAMIGKLVSKDQRDNSLRKLWSEVSPIMLNDGACTQEEISYINSQMDMESGRFANSNSKTLLYRNKLIAHNESHPKVEWQDVDRELSLLVRMWSLLVAWSSFGLYSPFRTNEQAFMGVGSVLTEEEIKKLKIERTKYLELVKEWSVKFAHTGVTDPGRGAFSTLKVEIKYCQ